MISEESRQEFNEFIESGECGDAVTLILSMVEHLFPGDRRKQGTSIVAAHEFFKHKYGPKVTSRH